MTPRVGSLFTGYGGLDLAVETYFGARTVWTSDIDPGASKIIAHRMPHAPNLGDLTLIDWTAVEPVEILTGGFPCQDVSTAGKRAGLKPSTRSGLWSHMAYAIDQLRPRYVVAENVRGLLSAEAHSDVEPCPWCMGDPTHREPDLRALGAVLGDMAELGYDARWIGLRAADIGAPHGRFRVFVVATDTRRESRHTRGGSCGSREREATEGTGTLGRAGGRHRDAATNPAGARRQGAHGRRIQQGGESAGRDHGGSSVPAVTSEREPSGSGGPDRALVTLLPTPQAHDAKQGGGESKQQRDGLGRFPNPALADLPHLDWGPYEQAVRRWEAALGRSSPAPTLLTPRGSERLAPRFVEWMMGLPAGWVTDVPDLSRNAQLKALGNGVVPQQAHEALRRALG